MRKQNESVTVRQSRIIDLLENSDFLTVKDLSEMLHISEVTIRRDLGALQSQGRINRRHGGAFAATDGNPAADATSAAVASRSPAERIAARAASLVEPGNVVLLSAGPISELMAETLGESAALTVITNSVAVFDILRTSTAVHLVATGGEFRHGQNTLIGPLAEASIREIRVDKLFLEPAGIATNHQMFHSSYADVPMIQAMIRAAREIIVMAESSTFGNDGTMPIAPLHIAKIVVSDEPVTDSIVREVENEGVQIVVA